MSNETTPAPAVGQERLVRQFFEWLVEDGFYALKIDGENFLLEDKTDVDKALEKLAKAPDEVKRYRHAQAQAWVTRYDAVIPGFRDGDGGPLRLPNVKEHAPSPAGASVDSSGKPEPSPMPENRAAGGGCCVSSCSASWFSRAWRKIRDTWVRILESIVATGFIW